MKRHLLLLLTLLAAVSCMKYGPREEEQFAADLSHRGVFVLCEGNYMYGNASLTYYDPESKSAENEVFARSNAFPLGDVAQSMTIFDGLCWVVVNNSGVIFAIDPSTFREVRRITGFTSPRYIHFIDSHKAYVTQIWDPRIYIVDPNECRITGYIETGMDFETGSTEMMVQIGDYVHVNCWSYQNRILKIESVRGIINAHVSMGSCFLHDGSAPEHERGSRPPYTLCKFPCQFFLVRIRIPEQMTQQIDLQVPEGRGPAP